MERTIRTRKGKKLVGKIVKVRMEKEYPEAKSHVAIGEVLEETIQYLRIRCRTYHFGKYKNQRNIKTGSIQVRCFPWHRIAVITELSQSAEWQNPKVRLNEEGRLILDDGWNTEIEEAAY